VRALLAFVVVTVASTPLIYFLSITVAPPVTPDGHPVMPVAAAGLALVGGPLVGLVAGLLVSRWGRDR
jgi:hypothetical protein